MATQNYLSTSSGGTWSTSIVGKDTNSTTSSRPTISNTSTMTRNPYLVFNCSVPSGATVTAISAQIKMRAYSSSYTAKAQLYNGTSSISNAYSTTSTSTSNIGTITATSIPNSFNDLRIYVGNSSTQSNRRPYVYGAHITITYTVDNVTITTTLSGSGTIDPDGETSVPKNSEFTLYIYPESSSSPVTATKDGVDITSSLVERHASGGTYSEAPNDSSSTGLSSGSNYVSAAVGHTAENPSSAGGNWYSGQSTKLDGGYARYDFDLSSIPENATITSVSCVVRGQAEDSTHNYSSGGRYCHWQLMCGSTEKGEYAYTTSTSSTLVTITNCGTWTRDELDDLWLRNSVGYYGGRTLGVTLTIEYTVSGGSHYYTYTYTATANATISVVIGTPTSKTCVIRYNGSVITSTQETSQVDITYNGVKIITNLTGTKTLYCNGKVMSSDLVIGSRTLRCNGKIMKSDVTITVT